MRVNVRLLITAHSIGQLVPFFLTKLWPLISVKKMFEKSYQSMLFDHVNKQKNLTIKIGIYSFPVNP